MPLFTHRPLALIKGIKPWQKGQWRYLRQQLQSAVPNPSIFSDEAHLRSAAAWLVTAQDESRDGGIPGRHLLGKGWTKPYPKTTGDVIPTFLKLATRLADSQYNDRAEKCVHFLLPLQDTNGAFPAGESGQTSPLPSAFNTAQIISGLVAWHMATGDHKSLDSAIRAADWLLSVQEVDGAWRRHVFNDVASTHDSYLACWLAELGVLLARSDYLDAAHRNLIWVLSHRETTTGWIDLAGYDAQQQGAREALTHSIAYTLMGALRSARALGDDRAVSLIRQSAALPAELLLHNKKLPAILDWQWKAKTNYSCLTGAAQLAELWLTLHGMEPDVRFLEAARSALNIVKHSQSLENPNPAIRGGIPGSNPIWGSYIFMGLPNWASKFFIDALLLLEDAKQCVRVA